MAELKPVTVNIVPTLVPTQVAFSWKATLRTLLAVLIGAGIVVPSVLAIVQQYLGVYISPEIMGGIIWGSGLIVAISGAVTKIMALPLVNQWLTKLGFGAVPAAIANKVSTLPVIGTAYVDVRPTATPAPAIDEHAGE